MKTKGVGEIKAHFSDILEQVKSGEKIVIAFGKKKKKVAVIVPYEEYRPRGQRRLGPLQGKAGFEIRHDFGFTDDDLLDS
jgi:prevent-host-death family protein